VEHGGVDLAGIGALPSGNYASTGLALNGLYSFNAFGSEEVRTYVGAGPAWLTEVELDGEGATDGRIRADYEPWAATLSVGWRF
jgi:hypothetical protein